MNKHYFTFLLLLILGLSASSEIQAQKQIMQLSQTCFDRDDVEIKVIRNINKDNKTDNKVIITYSFSDPDLFNDFIAAFEAEKENASPVIEEKKNRRMVPKFYRFITDEGTRQYTFDTNLEKTEITEIFIPKKTP